MLLANFLGPIKDNKALVFLHLFPPFFNQHHAGQRNRNHISTCPGDGQSDPKTAERPEMWFFFGVSCEDL
jgi:hypothetical protein